MIDEQFIAIATPRFIKGLRSFLKIEKSDDSEYIKKSGKSFIGWHPTANIGKPLWEYFKKHNLPCYFVERGSLPNTVIIDADGFLCESSSYDETNWNYPLSTNQECKIDAYINELKNNEISLEFQKSKRISKKLFHQKLKLSNNELIFVPLQLEGDTVIKKWSGWTKNINSFYSIIIQLAKLHKNKTFLVKPHPLSKIKFIDHENIINVDKFHYKDCLAYSDKVLTINSGLGLQAMAWYKPTIITGKSFYQFNGINYQANNIDDINHLLENRLKVERRIAKRFLYFLKFTLYSDCIQKKRKESRFINRTDEIKYTKVRIFKNKNEKIIFS